MMKRSVLTRTSCLVMLFVAIASICCEDSPQLVYPKQTISSGRVNTNAQFAFQYGKIEASIKAPKTKNGLWPAFWLLGDDFSSIGWPRCGEIDIMEMGAKAGIDGNTQERFLSRATHWGAVQNGGHPSYAINGNYPSSLQDDFHLYTMTWDKRYIRMYLDLDKNPAASPYYEILIDAASPGANAGQYPVKDYFHHPFFIVFNVAVGGDFPQIYTVNGISALNAGNNYEASMYIDYVKVYDEGDTLIWQDLFDGGSLDETKWNVEENDAGGGNSELQSYRRQNVSIKTEPETGKQCLTLSAKR